MKIGALIIARLGSSRLPQKHLRKAADLSFLEILIERIQRNAAIDPYIITSDEPKNREFEKFAHVSVFYGAVRNIPFRCLQAAHAYGLEGAILVDGDDVLCSVEAMVQVRKALESGRELVATEGLPLGMNCSGLRRELLERCLRGKETAVLETGWGRIFKSELKTMLKFGPFPGAEQLRFTLDYPEDEEFFRAVIEHFSRGITAATDEEIIRYAYSSGLFRKNSHLHEVYMANFRKELERESADD